MYFIGATTRQSSINQVFPKWAAHLQLGNCVLRGLDFPLHDDPRHYRAVVDFIKRDPRTLGALVTTHKIDLFNACRDLFEAMDPVTQSLGEISSIYKREGLLHARAVDPWTVGYALDSFIPSTHWERGAEVLILGAGGAGTALAWHFCNGIRGASRPARLHVADIMAGRLAHLRGLHRTWPDAVPLECTRVSVAAAADELLALLPARSLVVNATGVGKDTPGSPITSAAVFPPDGIVWEFNYRGDLVFLDQARAQKQARRLHIEDGWTYFLHGWTQVLGDVFGREIPRQGPLFDELGRIAGSTC
jgi:shikimate 5-dehydrogenase